MIEQDLNVDAEFQELLAKYTAATVLDENLCNVNIVPRAVLIDPWMKEGDLGFIYGARGSGKTWLVNLLCQHLGNGEELEGWKVPAPANIIYVDGEMPAEDSRARIEGLGVTGRVWLLNHELLWQKSEIVMNLADPKIQGIVTALCVQKEAKLLVLDNLSCLFQGVKENDNDEWEKVLNWLLDLRRRKIAVLIVHHAGRANNGMRGASRREDAAFWIIKVEKIEGDGGDVGAHFRTVFEKQRSQEREWDKEWHVTTNEEGKTAFNCKEVGMDSRILDLVANGINTAGDIAAELGCTKSWVSKKATKLISKGELKNSGRKYVIPTSNGNKTAWKVGGYDVDQLIDLLPDDGKPIHVSEWERKSDYLGMSEGVFMTLKNTAFEKKPVFTDKQGMVWRDASSKS